MKCSISIGPGNSSQQRRRYGNSDSKIHLTAYDKGSVVTVDDSGFIRIWEVNQSQIAKSLEAWKSNVGGILSCSFFNANLYLKNSCP
jgi:hypothetical protein